MAGTLGRPARMAGAESGGAPGLRAPAELPRVPRPGEADGTQPVGRRQRLANRRRRIISASEMYRFTIPRPLTAPRTYRLSQYGRSLAAKDANLSQLSVQGKISRKKPISTQKVTNSTPPAL